MVGEPTNPPGCASSSAWEGACRERQRPRAGRGAGPLGTCEAKAGAGVRRHDSEQHVLSWWRRGRVGCNSACPTSHRVLARNVQWESRCPEAGAIRLVGCAAPVWVAYRCDQGLAGRPSWFVTPPGARRTDKRLTRSAQFAAWRPPVCRTSSVMRIRWTVYEKSDVKVCLRKPLVQYNEYCYERCSHG